MSKSHSIDKDNTLQRESTYFNNIAGIESIEAESKLSVDFDPKQSPFINPKISKQSDKFQQHLQREHPVDLDSNYAPSCTDSIISRFPIIKVLSNYDRNTFVSDISTGITIGVQLLPKGMAYAMMAGLSKSNGVIVAMVSSLLYPLCGSTPFLCTGPDPIICLLISKVIDQLSFSEENFDIVKTECGRHCPDTLREEWVSEKAALIG
eukprot:369991_1